MIDIKKFIEALSLKFVLTDIDDKDGIKNLLDSFKELKKYSNKKYKEVAKVSGYFIDELSSFNAKDEPKRLGIFKSISISLSKFQGIFLNGKSETETDFSTIYFKDQGRSSDIIRSNKEDINGVTPTQITGLKEKLDSITPPEETGVSVEDLQENEIILPNESLERKVEFDLSIVEEFAEEANEHIDAAEMGLLELETDPENIEMINAVFRAFHSIKGLASFLELEDMTSLMEHTEDMLDKLRRGDLQIQSQIIDILLESVEMTKKLLYDLITSAKEGIALPKRLLLGDLIFGLEKALNNNFNNENQDDISYRKLGDILLEKGLISKDNLNKALTEQKEFETMFSISGIASTKKKLGDSIRVDTKRLDKLIDTIGEIVITQSMVLQNPELQSVASIQFIRNCEHLNKITRELQELGLSMRMEPISFTFHKMARIVRELSRKANKKINFNISGEETELDRSLIERIIDPLIHLLRNSVDHGIEGADERQHLGKPKVGNISLKALHEGDSIYIEVEDDGQGLDKEKILDHAVKMNLISDGTIQDDKEIFNLIFAPGFSTAEKVTNVSGRGVGMDVVKRNIEALRGSINIDSEKDKGTKFGIRLPLTLAIIDGMILKVGGEVFIIPTLSIVRSLRPTKDMIVTFEKKFEMVHIQNEILPLFRISKLFNIEHAVDNLTDGIVIIIEHNSKKFGIFVDSLTGQQQTVIKSLGPIFDDVKGISGGAIMPNGKIALILDIPEVIKSFISGKQKRANLIKGGVK